MPLQMMISQNRYAPALICDHCYELIRDAHDGIYEWQVNIHGDSGGAIFFVHKQCCDEFERQHGGRRAWFWANMELLPVMLGENLHLQWNAAFRLMQEQVEAE